MHIWHTLTRFVKAHSPSDRKLLRFIQAITGCTPRSLSVYHLAFQHISVVRGDGGPSKHAHGKQRTTPASILESNERLEFLGDAILGGVIAEYLYKKYPLKDEGYMTEMRSRIVSRQNLNDVCLKLGLETMLNYDRMGNAMNRSIYGNTLEAFIGALYLDQGYARTRKFLVSRVLTLCINVDKLAEQDLNFKSQLLHFAQRNKLPVIRFDVVEENIVGRMKEFTIAAMSGRKELGRGADVKKKIAEQKASEAALEKLLALEAKGKLHAKPKPRAKPDAAAPAVTQEPEQAVQVAADEPQPVAPAI